MDLLKTFFWIIPTINQYKTWSQWTIPRRVDPLRLLLISPSVPPGEEVGEEDQPRDRLQQDPQGDLRSLKLYHQAGREGWLDTRTLLTILRSNLH